MRFKQLIWTLFFLLFSHITWGQLNTLRIKKIPFSTKNIQFDSLSVLPNSLVIRCGEQLILPQNYTVDYAKAQLLIHQKCADSLTITYRVLPVSFARKFQLRDTTQLYRVNKGNRDLFLIAPTVDPIELMATNGLKKSGSIARGISFGSVIK